MDHDNGVDVEVKDSRRFDDAGERKIPFKKHEIAPINNWVLIRKEVRAEEKTDAGVILLAGITSHRGRVVAVAEGVPLAVDDFVIFTGHPLDFDDLEELTGDKDLRLVRYEEVYARVKEIA